MLDFLGETAQGDRLRSVVADAIARNAVTEDLGGTLTTEQMTEEIIQKLGN